MVMASIVSACCFAAVAGCASHLVYFIRGEHHRDSLVIVGVYFMTFVLMTVGQIRFLQQDIITSFLRSIAIFSSYIVALWSSMIVYRLFFHPLKHFPGPFAAKVSKLWNSYMVYPAFDNYRLLGKLQKEYGDIVRTGPNEVAIFSPNGIPVVLGPKCSKAPWYDNTLPLVSIHTTRDMKLHGQRRRLWEKGINAKALRSYEERILDVAQSVVDQMKSLSGQVINVRDWFIWFSFDVTGAIAFGKDFGCVKTGKSHFVLDIILSGVAPFALLNPIPWAFPFLGCLPNNPVKKLVSWCAEMVAERQRLSKDMEVGDVMSHLIHHYEESTDKADQLNWLTGDARIIILAGTETSAITLTFISYQLAKNASQQAQLRAEVSPLVEQKNWTGLQDAAYLNGLINEALRLYSAGPSGLPRVTPPEGIMIGETFIPGNVNVYVPYSVVQRHPDAFEKPDEFIPERWFSQPELVKDNKAFAPWSLGSTSCAGKQLALLEIRLLVSLLITNFEVKFAPGDDGRSAVEELTDHFTTTAGPLKLVFQPIKG